MPTAWLLASAVIGYLLGSLPFGYLVARAHGVDIFKVGNGNPEKTPQVHQEMPAFLGSIQP